MIQENHVLNSTEKKESGLKQDNTYILKFLFNGKQNQAHPVKFRIPQDKLEEFANEAIGKPFLVPEYGEKGHVGTDQKTFEGLLEFQKKYAIGEIVNYISNATTGNYYAIVEVWPQFQAAIERNMIPPFTSPTFVGSVPADGSGNGIPEKFANLQAVPYPGYEPEYAGITATCNAGSLDTCVQELKSFGAAASAASSAAATVVPEEIRQKFLNNSTNAKGSMSMQAQQQQEKPESAEGLAGISKKLEDIGKAITDNTKLLTDFGTAFETNAGILKAIADNVEGIDGSKVILKIGESSAGQSEGGEKEGAGTGTGTGAQPAAPQGSAMGAAGTATTTVTQTEKPEVDSISKHPEVIALRKELESIKNLSRKREQEIADEKRLLQATTIVESLIKLKEIPLAEKDDKIKFYFELKNDDRTLRDLSLFADDIKTRAQKMMGASGSGDYYARMPHLTGESNKITNSQMMEALD